MFKELEHDLVQFIGIMLAAVVAGFAFDQLVSFLLLGTSVFFGYHFFRLRQLQISLSKQQRLKASKLPGLWNDIYRKIRELQIQSRKRKRNLTRFSSRFKLAARAIPDALIILNQNQTVLWANPAASAFLGVAWPKDEHRSLDELIDRPELTRYIKADDFTRPLEFSPKANNSLMLSVRITPFGKKKRQRLLVARDITQIYHLNQTRKDFVANVSHELRTPLTVISGFVETLLHHEDSDEKFQRPLELMKQQSARMQLVIEDLLSLSRLELLDAIQTPSPVNIVRMLEIIIEEAENLYEEKSHRLFLDATPTLQIRGVESELHSAFSNLIFNAVKHTPEGTKIHISWRCEKEHPTLTVKDSGEGVEAEHLPRLTERFYRVDKGRSRESGGTGLGLAIVKHVLNRHQAEFFISSKKGKGSTFKCRFSKKAALVINDSDKLKY